MASNEKSTSPYNQHFLDFVATAHLRSEFSQRPNFQETLMAVKMSSLGNRPIFLTGVIAIKSKHSIEEVAMRVAGRLTGGAPFGGKDNWAE